MIFLQENWANVLVVLSIVVVIIIAIRLGYIKQVKQVLLSLVTEAEKKYGDKTGKLKFSAVAEQIYAYLPSIARMFISAKLIEKLINGAVDEMKKYLEDNKNAEMIVKSQARK